LTDELREKLAVQALPLMTQCFRELIGILNRVMGAPMPQAGLVEMGMSLELRWRGGTLLVVRADGSATPPGMERFRKA